jgi:hypothetical protein
VLLREFFKQNFKVKCESGNSRVIAWQHSFVNNIIYESMLFLLRVNHSKMIDVFQLREFRGVLLANICY